ncbi:hypothetical protein F4804DRAFT_301450 [Jackrogersella minutella]|nr:hypothetical protein F4804DRAFT_301450 [Jackrogersella minutella]
MATSLNQAVVLPYLLATTAPAGLKTYLSSACYRGNFFLTIVRIDAGSRASFLGGLPGSWVVVRTSSLSAPCRMHLNRAECAVVKTSLANEFQKHNMSLIFYILLVKIGSVVLHNHPYRAFSSQPQKVRLLLRIHAIG